MNIRQTNWNMAANNSFDVAIIGGGISGASIYQKLCKLGHKAILIDKSDFSGGTSQASAMMIWGGLLYLKNLDLVSVYKFSNDRDTLISSISNKIMSKHFRYILDSQWGRNKYYVYLALLFYWMLGKCRRERPKLQTLFEELDFISHGNGVDSLIFQEGFLKHSDSRFVLDFIFDHQTEDCMAINYCSIQNVHYNIYDKLWSLDLEDTFSNKRCTIKAKMLINCAGVWTDAVNEQFGIQSPYKHVFSKGVFVGFERPDKHRIPLIFDMGANGDVLSFIPWGPVSLWGPTETMEDSINRGYCATPEDIRFLLKHASRNLKSSLANSKIISLRCGLRPLAVKNSFKADCYPLDISRHNKIIEDRDLPWISIYGGKISGCTSMADNVAKRISKRITARKSTIILAENRAEEISWTSFPGLDDKVPSIDWCVSNEFCCTLEDYLRRRTNISQWVPREGLGFQNENIEYLREVSSRLPDHCGNNDDRLLNDYISSVRERFDKIIEQIQ